jgi:hypothetical protein
MDTKKKLNILDYLKKKKVKRFSLFFIIAFVFLIFSKLSNDYKQTIKLKVNLVNVQDEIILHNDSVNTIDAYIQAKGFSLIPFIFKSSTDIVLDVKTDVISRPNHFIFDVQKHQFIIEEQLGQSYQLISIMPDTIVLPFSKRAAKLVPITLKRKINYAVGYDIKGDFNFNVDSVKVVGPDLEVEKVTSLATKTLVLNDVNTNISASVQLDLSDYDQIEVFPKRVSVSGEVTRFTEGTIEIPIIITNKPSDIVINYFPKTVKLVYYVDLENYSAIEAKDFTVECNYSDIEDNQSYFDPKIVRKPAFVKRVSIKQKRIDFIKL